MQELLEKLGVNPALLLAQAGNFLLVFWLLKRYAFPRILSMIEERRERIAQGLEMRQTSERELQRTKEARTREIAGARKEAEQILLRARSEAEARERAIEAEAKEQAERILVRARQEAEAEKEAIIARAEGEMRALVTRAAEKVLERSLQESDEERLAGDALRAASQSGV